MENKYLVPVALVVLSIGCNNDTNGDSDVVDAFNHVAVAYNEAPQKVDAEKKMKALKKRAADEAKAARDKAWDELIVVPDGARGDIKATCASLGTAFDNYKTARITGPEKQRWDAIKRADIDNVIEACNARGNVAIAACQEHALSHADATFSADDASHMLTECEERIASAGNKKTAAGAP